MIVYVENIKNIREYNKLSKAVGWGIQEESVLEVALDKTIYSISAYEEGEILGYGRIVGDETMFLYIQDMMVLPEYQHQKIGSTIMKKLLEKIDEYKIKNPDLRVYVGPSYGKEDFYRKFGFKTRVEARLGEGMILMNDEPETKLWSWEEDIPDEELKEIIDILDDDGVIIFPTDTVYGLACNCHSEKALERIFDMKKRARYKPICVLTDSVDKIKEIATVKPKEEKLIKKYMPGALTIILDKKEDTPDILTAGLDTIGVRIPDNEIALTILKNCKYPLATTSANVSGEDAGVDVQDFITFFDGKVDAIIDGGKTKLQVASTIIKLENDEVKVLRQGSLKIDEE